METMMSELPLALFTTFAPVGAGAFVVLAVAFATTTFDDEKLARIDKMTAIPVAVTLLGLVCAFFHLANPMNALGVFSNVGSSPLSNEIVAVVVFVVAMLVYWVCALLGKLGTSARKGFAAVVAVLAVVLACFTGAAYMMDTIASWNSPAVPVQMVGFALAGGGALGVLVIALAGALGEARASRFKAIVLVAIVGGMVLAAAGLIVQVAGVSGLSNALVAGEDLVGQALTPLIVGIACLVVAAVLACAALAGKSAKVLASCAPVVAVIGVFACRVAFYAVQMSVGLYIA